ncbi:hypothetical protein EDB81DRAFT_718566 [Dactylonectria macrodidyma]|uniref:Arylamine N-acetyltransferase n=1 Tax=Dactylonectria macrodidyma TaxID=307937 RepID=A0A9P9F5Y7_9HYPO|nr:hypothetical protein EDB81DRAFT_718566 [Dactylonectria macrodidyma]
MASAYSFKQLQQFYAHIGLPEHLHHEPPTLSLLQALHVHTLSTLPYENLSLHYNASHQIQLDPQHLFRKIVTNSRGRGGFCMEIAILYNHILRAAGFDAYTAGVRTRGRLEGVPRGDYPGCKYHVDVAFGGDGALFPMPLIEGLVHQNLGTQQIRLVRDWIPHQVHKTEETKLWVYQYRNGVDKDWNSFYSFPGIEFYALDWGVVNFWIGAHPDSHQRFNMLVIKFLRRPKETEGKQEEHEIYGKRMLINNVVKENLGGKTRVVAECKSEADRIEALEKCFSIVLEAEEKDGIQGYFSELTILHKRHLGFEEIPGGPFLLRFHQRLPILAHIHPPQLIPMPHQQFIPALLRVRPHAKVLVRLVMADPGGEPLPFIMANVRPRDAVAEAEPAFLLDASPVVSAGGVEAFAQLQLAVGESDGHTALSMPYDEDLVRARHRLRYQRIVSALSNVAVGGRDAAIVSGGCRGHVVAKLEIFAHGVKFR